MHHEVAHDEVVGQPFTGILTCRDATRKPALGERHEHDHLAGNGADRRCGARDLDALRAIARNGEIDRGGRALAADARHRGLERARAPVAKVAAAEHHLRRIDVARARSRLDVALALRAAGRGERILPADVIPVVHVEGKRHDATGRGLQREARKPAIRGRAARAAFRGVQLDERRDVRR